MKNKLEVSAIIFLILLLLIINYDFIDGKLESFLNEGETGFVERVIDGDTAVINGNSTRLLGINTPEKGERYYEEAKKFLEDKTLNKTVAMKFGKDKVDLYGRKLAYVFLGRENVNLRLVEEGFANFYFPSGKDSYYDKFAEAWEKCIDSDKRLCEKSTNICVDCIELKRLDDKSQEVIFYNKCSFSCDITGWEIKDEGRKKFLFPTFFLNTNSQVKVIVDEKENSGNILYWRGEDYVWTSSGDTIFLRDREGRLVIWKSY